MSVLAADLEVKVNANIAEALKKLSSIERYAQQTTNALNKPSKLNLDTKDAEKKLTSFSQKLKDSFKASLAGLNEAGRGLLAGDSVGFFSGLIDTVTGLTSQIPLLGSAATLAGNGVKTLIMPMEKLFSMGMQWQGMWEKNKKLLVSYGDSAEDAEKQLNGLYQMSIKRGFQMDDLALIYQRMRSIGFSADDAKEKLKAFTNAAAAIGGGAEAVQTMAAAFEQMKDSEMTASRVIKQFERMGLPIMQTLSSATGFSPQKIREMMKKEQIDSDGLMDILTKEFQSGRFTNLAENMAKGLGGQQNAFSQITAKLAGEATANIRSVMGARLRDVNEIIGSDSAEGLILGFKKGLDIPLSGADYLVSGFLGALKSYLGIKSPSALLRDEIGVPMGLGLLAGFELALQQEGDRIQKSATAVITKAGDTLSTLAEKYKVPIEKLRERFPHLQDDDEIPEGQRLYVPNDKQWKAGMRGKPSRRLTNPINNSSVSQWDALIEESAQRNGIDPNMVRAIMQIESHGKNGLTSSAGAQGLMQLMPKTGRRFGVTNPFDPAQNIEGGTEYLAYLLKLFGGNTDLVAAGYNAGEGNVQKYGMSVPPFAQTQNYVRQFRQLYSGGGGLPAARTFSENFNELGQTADISGGADALRELRQREQELAKQVEKLNDQLGQHADYFADMNARARGIDVQFQPGTQKVVDDLKRARQDLADVRAQIVRGQAELNAARAQRTASTPTEPTYDLSGIDAGDYPMTSGLMGGIGSIVSLAKQYLPDVLKLAGELRSRELPQLKDGWNALNHTAQNGLARTGEEIRKNRDEFRKSGQTLGEVKNLFQSTFASAFSSTEGGFKGMLGRFVTSFAQALLQMAAQAAATRLADLIFGDPAAKGGGNWFSKLLQIGISAIGGSVGGGHAGGGGGWGSFNPGFPTAHKDGGWMRPGEMSWVGEAGPELMQAGPHGAQIYSNSDSRKMAGGNTYHIHVHVPPSRTGYMQPRDRRALAQDIVGGLQLAGAGA